MALIKCPECGNDVSSETITCPHCGYTINKEEAKKQERIRAAQANQHMGFGSVVLAIIVGLFLYYTFG